MRSYVINLGDDKFLVVPIPDERPNFVGLSRVDLPEDLDLSALDSKELYLVLTKGAEQVVPTQADFNVILRALYDQLGGPHG